MNTKIIVIILMAFLFTACGKSLGSTLLTLGGKRDPDRVGFLSMTIYEMFPNDRQLRSLALAASSGDIKKIDKLVASGVDVNAVGERGLPAAFWVLFNPNKEGFKRLMEHGANPNILLKTSFAGSEYYTSLIHKAAGLHVDVEYLKMILEIGKGNPNLTLPDSGTRPIQEAVYPGKEEFFSLLYSAGAEVNYNDGYDTLLDNAFSASNYELGFFLLKQGVGFIKNGKWGDTAASDFMLMALQLKTGNLFNPWFWRCVEYYEKQGVVFDIPVDVEKIRPAVLDTRPTAYEIEIERQRKLQGVK